MRVTFAQTVAATVVFVECLPAGIDRVADRGGQVALVRALLEQLCTLRARQLVGETEGASELRGSLAVRSVRGRALAGGARVEQHRLPAARRFRMVREACEVDALTHRARKRSEREAVECQLSVGRQRGLDSNTRDLVAEGHRVVAREQHARCEACLEMDEVIACERLEQPQLSAGRRDRDGVEQCARPRAQARRARQDRVAHGVGERCASRGERLRDVERIAGGPPVQDVRVRPVRVRQFRHGCERERLKGEARDGGRRQFTERDTQRMIALELGVATCDNDERRNGRHPARQQAEQVERRLVGPVQVLEYDDSRLAEAQLVEERAEHGARARTSVDQRREVAARLDGHVDERPEGQRRLERFAGAGEHPCSVVESGAERLHEGRLADAGLAGDEDDAAAPCPRHRRECGGERFELVGALEELVAVRPERLER